MHSVYLCEWRHHERGLYQPAACDLNRPFSDEIRLTSRHASYRRWPWGPYYYYMIDARCEWVQEAYEAFLTDGLELSNVRI